MPKKSSRSTRSNSQSNVISAGNQLTLDSKMLEQLYKECGQSSSPFSEIEYWTLSALLDRDVSKDEPATFEEMEALWHGRASLNPLHEDKKSEYLSFAEVKGFGPQLSSFLTAYQHTNSLLTEADISHFVDAQLLLKYLPKVSVKRATVLEIGAGSGLLASHVLKEKQGTACYILSDAIPESLLYQEAHLRAKFPELSIGSAFAGDEFNAQKFDAFLVPAWQLQEVLADCALDMIVNIASMQEMEVQASEAYLQFFEAHLAEGGALMLRNSREYHYSRQYAYPKHWQYVEKMRVPMSRGLDYPLDILVRCDTDQSAHNMEYIERYYLQVVQRAGDTIKSKNKQIKGMERFAARRESLNKKNLDRLVSKQLATLENFGNKQTAMVEKFGQKKAQLLEKLASKAKHIHSLKEKIDVLNQEKQVLRASLKSLKTEHADRQEALKATVSRYRDHVLRLKALNCVLQERNNNLAIQKADLLRLLKAHQVSLGQAKKKVSKLFHMI